LSKPLGRGGGGRAEGTIGWRHKEARERGEARGPVAAGGRMDAVHGTYDVCGGAGGPVLWVGGRRRERTGRWGRGASKQKVECVEWGGVLCKVGGCLTNWTTPLPPPHHQWFAGPNHWTQDPLRTREGGNGD